MLNRIPTKKSDKRLPAEIFVHAVLYISNNTVLSFHGVWQGSVLSIPAQ